MADGKKRKVSHDLIAGATAGTLAATLTNPLELVKTRLQARHKPTELIAELETSKSGRLTLNYLNHVARNEGVRGLWRGIGPTLVGVAPSRASYFAVYASAKAHLTELSGTENALVHMGSAFSAGFITSTITNPIWLVKTRLQLHHEAAGETRPSIPRIVVDIYRQNGLKGYLKGLSASYLGIAETMVQFVIYEKLKRHLGAGSRQEELSKMEYFGAAATAKTVACISTYPHEVARTRLREPHSSLIYRNVFHLFGVVLREEGVRALYSGLGTHLMRVVPSSAIMFLTYEFVVRRLEELQL